MLVAFFRFLPPVVALLAIIFLIVRFRLFSSLEHQGRPALLIGSFLALVASLWQPVRAVSDYNDWFMASAYPVIDVVQMATLLVGLLLMVVGIVLYMDYWQSRRENLREREERLSLLDNLQRDARQPYQLLELFAISLREILSTLSGCSGVVFLIHRGKRQFVLATSSGLSKQELAGVEQYPYGGNIVTQAVELAEPMIGGGFEFTGRHRQTGDSRYRSTMVLPLVTGMERVGAVLLLSDRDQAFSTTEIAYLSPVVEWLAEKVKSARLARELALVNRKADDQNAHYQSLNDRLSASARQISSSADLTPFCRTLVGLLGSDSVQLCAEKAGHLEIVAGSEATEEPSESLRTALVDAVNRSKPLIINQERTDESDNSVSVIVQSTLVCPIVAQPHGAALLLRRFNQAFVVSDVELGHIEPFVLLAQMALLELDNHRHTLTRRRGIDSVLELLKPINVDSDPMASLANLAKIVESGLPENSLAIPFGADMKPCLYNTRLKEIIDGHLKKVQLKEKNNWFENARCGEKCEILFGYQQVLAMIESLGEESGKVLKTLLGVLDSPTFLAGCPVSAGEESGNSLLMVFVPGLGQAEKMEVDRFLTLATSLFTLRRTVGLVASKHSQEMVSDEVQSGMSALSNDLNNSLSAVIGRAELVSTTAGIPDSVRDDLEVILGEAEKAAAIVRGKLLFGNMDELPADNPDRSIIVPASAVSANSCRLHETLSNYLHRHHISANLYMISGSPREIELTVDGDSPAAIRPVEIRRFLDSFIRNLCSRMSDDSLLTLRQYDYHDNVYLDACLHRKHFPPVERLALSGQYREVGNIIAERPGDNFLAQLSGLRVSCALDSLGNPPAFYSFRFSPTIDSGEIPTAASASSLKLLAIDDQQVILDLILAMGQSQGFDVTAVSSGTEGLRLAERNRFDIILTDLAMPDLSGTEVARRLLAMGIEVPVVLITGWEANFSDRDLASAGISRVLYKPFRIEQLSEVILSLTGQPN